MKRALKNNKQKAYERDISSINGSDSSLSAMVIDSDTNNVVQNEVSLQKAFENPEVIAKFTTQFTVQCSSLIQKSLKATNEKVEAIGQTMIDNTRRIVTLETITDDFKQSQRDAKLFRGSSTT